MDERNTYREHSSDRMGNGGAIADQVAETAQNVAEGAAELGSEALDRTDEWLKPFGLSLREKPMMTLAVLGGLGIAVGALWKSRSNQYSYPMNQMMQAWDQISRRYR